MLHICTAKNRHLYQAQLQEMHRQRYELFVRSKGWNLAVREGGEYDAGDDERAVYLMALDETQGCYGSIRLRPADDFSMLIDAMPQYVEGDARSLRSDPMLWEMARWVNVGGDPRAGQEMRIGLVEYLLGLGVGQCIGMTEATMMAYAIRTGWRLRALGAALPYPEGGVAIATVLTISQAEVSYLRTLTGRDDPFLIEIDPAAPWATLPLNEIEDAYRAVAPRAASVGGLAAEADAVLRGRTTARAA